MGLNTGMVVVGISIEVTGLAATGVGVALMMG